MVASYDYISPEAYLLWEEQQPTRHEYIQGKVLAMAGGTMPHVDIIVNLGTILRNQLRGKGCKVRTSDAKVAISDQGAFFYPDIDLRLPIALVYEEVDLGNEPEI